MSTKAAAYMNLVGVLAMGTKCGTSKEVRVVAGDSKTSLLYNKISEAKPDCGGRSTRARSTTEIPVDRKRGRGPWPRS
jgi:hypothetical protein